MNNQEYWPKKENYLGDLSIDDNGVTAVYGSKINEIWTYEIVRWCYQSPQLLATIVQHTVKSDA